MVDPAGAVELGIEIFGVRELGEQIFDGIERLLERDDDFVVLLALGDVRDGAADSVTGGRRRAVAYPRGVSGFS